MAEWMVTVICIAEGVAYIEADTAEDARSLVALVGAQGPAVVQGFLGEHAIDLSGDATFMQVADVEPQEDD